MGVQGVGVGRSGLRVRCSTDMAIGNRYAMAT